MSANVKIKSDTVNSGHTAGWIGVDGNITSWDPNCNGNSADLSVQWIQAGIDHTYGYSLTFYIEYKVHGEYCPHYSTSTVAPSYNTNYAVSIQHVANGQWNATVNGYSLGTITTGGTMTESDFTTEGFNAGGATPTNALDFVFSSLSPWTTSQMNPLIDPIGNNELVLANVTSASFEAIQYSYDGSCYPNFCNGQSQ